MNLLVVDGPALTAQQDMNPPVTITHPGLGNLADTLPDHPVVTDRPVVVTGTGHQDHRTGSPDSNSIGLVEMVDQVASKDRL
jgi:hypothetical protein